MIYRWNGFLNFLKKKIITQLHDYTRINYNNFILKYVRIELMENEK